MCSLVEFYWFSIRFHVLLLFFNLFKYKELLIFDNIFESDKNTATKLSPYVFDKAKYILINLLRFSIITILFYSQHF